MKKKKSSSLSLSLSLAFFFFLFSLASKPKKRKKKTETLTLSEVGAVFQDTCIKKQKEKKKKRKKSENSTRGPERQKKPPLLCQIMMSVDVDDQTFARAILASNNNLFAAAAMVFAEVKRQAEKPAAPEDQPVQKQQRTGIRREFRTAAQMARNGYKIRLSAIEKMERHMQKLKRPKTSLRDDLAKEKARLAKITRDIDDAVTVLIAMHQLLQKRQSGSRETSFVLEDIFEALKEYAKVVSGKPISAEAKEFVEAISSKPRYVSSLDVSSDLDEPEFDIEQWCSGVLEHIMQEGGPFVDSEALNTFSVLFAGDSKNCANSTMDLLFRKRIDAYYPNLNE